MLVDWSQNSRHKTTVAVYSLRARPRPTVSTPVTWDEVEAAADGEPLSFETADVLARVDELGDLFADALDGHPTAAVDRPGLRPGPAPHGGRPSPRHDFHNRIRRSDDQICCGNLFGRSVGRSSVVGQARGEEVDGAGDVVGQLVAGGLRATCRWPRGGRRGRRRPPAAAAGRWRRHPGAAPPRWSARPRCRRAARPTGRGAPAPAPPEPARGAGARRPRTGR